MPSKWKGCTALVIFAFMVALVLGPQSMSADMPSASPSPSASDGKIKPEPASQNFHLAGPGTTAEKYVISFKEGNVLVASVQDGQIPASRNVPFEIVSADPADGTSILKFGDGKMLVAATDKDGKVSFIKSVDPVTAMMEAKTKPSVPDKKNIAPASPANAPIGTASGTTIAKEEQPSGPTAPAVSKQ